ncbi:MAG: xanthine dehydrogenase family protein molybdopterin-binding subunit [Bacillota bacterium]
MDVKQLKRDDVLFKVTGRAEYCGDLYFANMAHGAIVRSPVPRGILRKINAEKALALPGVKAVFTAGDCPGSLGAKEEPKVLVEKEIMYKGAPLAIVVADSEAILAHAVSLVELDIEELPGVFTPEEALLPSAPVLYGQSNQVCHLKMRKGDMEEGFAQADLVLEREYQTSWVSHMPLESDIALALPEKNGMIVYCPTKGPYYVRFAVAAALGLPLSAIRIVLPAVGSSYGAKGPDANIIASQAALAAYRLGIPVRIRYSLQESLATTAKRHACNIRIKGGFKTDGTYVSCEVALLGDAGCYLGQTLRVADRQVVEATGPYRIPNVKTDVIYAYTNNVYADAMRGFGSPQVDFASEQFIDEAAAVLGLDPIVIREKNALKEGDLSATSQMMDHVTLLPCLETIQKSCGWRQKKEEFAAFNQKGGGVKRGIGVSAMYRGECMGAGAVDAAGVNVHVHPDGSINIYASIVEVGQGGHNMLKTVVANVLTVDESLIRVNQVDTSFVPDSGPTVASRGTAIAGNAALRAAQSIKDKLSKLAQEHWCGAPVVWENGILYTQDKSRQLTFKQAVRMCFNSGDSPYGFGWWVAPHMEMDTEKGCGDPYFGFVYGACAAEVEVDEKDGSVRILNFYATHDVGKAISMKGVENQVLGGVAMGVGYALTEDLCLEKGTVQAASLKDYRLPRFTQMPPVHIDVLEYPSKLGPFGARGLGEPATSIVAPAIYNAVADALHRRIYTMPLQVQAGGREQTHG